MNLKIYDFGMEMIVSSNKDEANTTWIVAISIQKFLIGLCFKKIRLSPSL